MSTKLHAEIPLNPEQQIICDDRIYFLLLEMAFEAAGEEYYDDTKPKKKKKSLWL